MVASEKKYNELGSNEVLGTGLLYSGSEHNALDTSGHGELPQERPYTFPTQYPITMGAYGLRRLSINLNMYTHYLLSSGSTKSCFNSPIKEHVLSSRILLELLLIRPRTGLGSDLGFNLSKKIAMSDDDGSGTRRNTSDGIGESDSDSSQSI